MQQNPALRFTETPHIRARLRTEKAVQGIFIAMTAAMILPLLGLICYLVIRAWPSLGLDFILEVPLRGMREGGIWPAFVGTIYLIVIALAGIVVLPIAASGDSAPGQRHSIPGADAPCGLSRFARQGVRLQPGCGWP